MEITPLPLKGVFAIIDLFQAVLEPSELFLQEEREMFQRAHGLRLEIPLQAPTTAPTTKHNVPPGSAFGARFPMYITATQKATPLSIYPARKYQTYKKQ